ncbi:MAG TPA: 1-acyl-sn-glycerol-3-phosphate acyltransferase, partial [Polyangiaceae bacterium]|nr:1-acyl-sn-glycerol-3-phosphate acyltransferase [Polyangiaceae bacterium]
MLQRASPSAEPARPHALPEAHARGCVLGGEDLAADVGERVIARALADADGARGRPLDELVYETLYAESSRLERAEGEPRTEADSAFLRWLRHELAHADQLRRRELVRAIIERYAREIAGHFDERVYRLATRVVPPALSALLQGKKLRDPTGLHIEQRVMIEGRVESLRALARCGTVVLAPTHVSNLDSLVLGSAIYRMGLPPFAYGAGLNLFSSKTTGFFMRNLGAYTVDRKKTDPLY